MTDNHVAELNAALAAAQGEFPPIPKDKTVKTASYEFSYASLDTIIDKCRPALAKNGLAIVQLLEDTGTGPALRTELRHASGASVGSSFPLTRVPESPQQLGSLLTYLRRYALTALLGVAAEEDDDGAHAAQPAAPAKTAAKPRMVTAAQHGKIAALIKSLDEAQTAAPAEYASADSWVDVLKQALHHRYEVSSRKELTAQQASDLIDWLEEQAIPF